MTADRVRVVEPTWVTVLRRVTIGLSVVAILCSMLAHACGCGAPFTLAPAAAADEADGSAGGEVLVDGSAGEEVLVDASADREVLVDGSPGEEVLVDASADREVLVDASAPADVDAAPERCCRTQGAGDMNPTDTPVDAGELGASCRVLAFEGVVTLCPEGT